MLPLRVTRSQCPAACPVLPVRPAYKAAVFASKHQCFRCDVPKPPPGDALAAAMAAAVSRKAAERAAAAGAKARAAAAAGKGKGEVAARASETAHCCCRGFFLADANPITIFF